MKPVRKSKISAGTIFLAGLLFAISSFAGEFSAEKLNGAPVFFDSGQCEKVRNLLMELILHTGMDSDGLSCETYTSDTLGGLALVNDLVEMGSYGDRSDGNFMISGKVRWPDDKKPASVKETVQITFPADYLHTWVVKNANYLTMMLGLKTKVKLKRSFQNVNDRGHDADCLVINVTESFD